MARGRAKIARLEDRRTERVKASLTVAEREALEAAAVPPLTASDVLRALVRAHLMGGGKVDVPATAPRAVRG
jgi:hypothetical protein